MNILSFMIEERCVHEIAFQQKGFHHAYGNNNLHVCHPSLLLDGTLLRARTVQNSPSCVSKSTFVS